MIEKGLKGGAASLVVARLPLRSYSSGLHRLASAVGLRPRRHRHGPDGLLGPLYSQLYLFVGVAASAVTVVLPYYLHNVKEFRRIVILGEFLAVSSVVMSLLFIIADLGRPDRAFNMIVHPTPTSLLFWDMIVLNGYLLLNLAIGWSTLDAEAKGEKPPAWVRFFIILSIPWAVSIHTVTAFIYQGLVARPLWHSALWAPRFLASAFASGPSLLILLALFLKKVSRFDAGSDAIRKATTIATYALLVNIFLLLVGLFTTIYAAVPEDTESLKYLFFGIDGHNALVPWMWASMALMGLSACALLFERLRNNEAVLVFICLAIFIGVWIDKGLGLVVPGLVPPPLGEIIEYGPTLPECLITAGVWALGALIVTVMYRVVVSVRESA